MNKTYKNISEAISATLRAPLYKTSQRLKFSKLAGKALTDREKMLELQIRKAFADNGIEGVMNVIQRSKTQAYDVAAKLGLIKQKVGLKNINAAVTHRKKLLDYLRSQWHWSKGQQVLTLKKSRLYRVKNPFMMGRIPVEVDDIIEQFVLPTGSMRKFMIENGLEYYSIRGKLYSVERFIGHALTIKV